MPAARHASFSGEAAVGQAISMNVTGVDMAPVELTTDTMDASSEVGSESGRKKVRIPGASAAVAGDARKPIRSISPVRVASFDLDSDLMVSVTPWLVFARKWSLRNTAIKPGGRNAALNALSKDCGGNCKYDVTGCWLLSVAPASFVPFQKNMS